MRQTTRPTPSTRNRSRNGAARSSAHRHLLANRSAKPRTAPPTGPQPQDPGHTPQAPHASPHEHHRTGGQAVYRAPSTRTACRRLAVPPTPCRPTARPDDPNDRTPPFTHHGDDPNRSARHVNSPSGNAASRRRPHKPAANQRVLSSRGRVLRATWSKQAGNRLADRAKPARSDQQRRGGQKHANHPGTRTGSDPAFRPATQAGEQIEVQ